MKDRILLSLVASMFSFASFAQIEVGGGLGFGTEISNLGLQARGQHSFNEQFDGTFNMTYFFPDKEKAGSLESKVSLFTLNFDAHYNAYANDMFEVYPLLGLNFAIVSVKLEGEIIGIPVDAKESQTEIGLNIGGGCAFFAAEGLKVFGEIKYVASDFDQVVFMFAVLKEI